MNGLTSPGPCCWSRQEMSAPSSGASSASMLSAIAPSIAALGPSATPQSIGGQQRVQPATIRAVDPPPKAARTFAGSVCRHGETAFGIGQLPVGPETGPAAPACCEPHSRNRRARIAALVLASAVLATERGRVPTGKSRCCGSGSVTLHFVRGTWLCSSGPLTTFSPIGRRPARYQAPTPSCVGASPRNAAAQLPPRPAPAHENVAPHAAAAVCHGRIRSQGRVTPNFPKAFG